MRRKTAKEILAESFREIAEKKPINKITVRDITDNCGYSSATFYRLYRPAGRRAFSASQPFIESVKAIPHKARLAPLHLSCLRLFRHIVQNPLDLRQQACVSFSQSDEKFDCTIQAQSLCGIALSKMLFSD